MVILKKLLGRASLSGAAIFWLVLAAGAALTTTYWVGKKAGKTQVREQTAIKQAKVTADQLVRQQNDHAVLNEEERALSAKRYVYESIIKNDVETQQWASQALTECASALSAVPSMQPDSCAVPAGRNTGEDAADSRRGENQR